MTLWLICIILFAVFLAAEHSNSVLRQVVGAVVAICCVWLISEEHRTIKRLLE